MGKWDGKRQAARRASRPQGAASAVADRRVRPPAEPPCGPVPAFCANFGQGSRPGSRPGKGLGKVDAGGRQNGAGPLHREKATRNGELAVCWGWGSCRGRGGRRGPGRRPHPRRTPPRRPAGGAPRWALRTRRRGGNGRGALRGVGGPFGRPGRAEIQRKYRVTSAPGPADGRRPHGFAAPVRGKCGCGGWPQQNPPGVRQIQAHPRRQSAPACPQ